MFSIYDLITNTPPTIRVVDIGAMYLGPNKDSFDALLKKGDVSIVGFEPVQSECERLNAMHGVGKHAAKRLYLPYAVGDGSIRTFNITNSLATSSLYEPYTELLDKFQNLENYVQVVQRKEMQTRRLDDIPEAAGADYIKVDVQGAELDVFRGAKNVLKDVVVVQTEVEFVPLYRGQPLFAEVDQILRENGFLFHKLSSTAGRMFKPLIRDNNPDKHGSQMLWADAVYIKNFMNLDELSSEKLLKLAIILHEIYDSLDTCAFVLQAYDRGVKDGLLERYYTRLLGK